MAPNIIWEFNPIIVAFTWKTKLSLHFANYKRIAIIFLMLAVTYVTDLCTCNIVTPVELLPGVFVQ